jgi:hypothetical protein
MLSQRATLASAMRIAQEPKTEQNASEYDSGLLVHIVALLGPNMTRSYAGLATPSTVRKGHDRAR